MPFYEKGDVRIRYEEAGSGFPLLVTPGRGLQLPRQQLADRGDQRHGGVHAGTSAASRWTNAMPTAASCAARSRSTIPGAPSPTTSSG